MQKRPPGDELNPLGLRDLASPDVSFDGSRIVFAGSTGPTLPTALFSPRIVKILNTPPAPVGWQLPR